jgi:hypothetical protein
MIPDKIYIQPRTIDKLPQQNIVYTKQLSDTSIEYIRKDFADEMVKLAEDHAYFAGQENLREKLLDWAKEKYNKAYKLHLKKGDNYAYGQGKMDAYQKLIDKLNSI